MVDALHSSTSALAQREDAQLVSVDKIRLVDAAWAEASRNTFWLWVLPGVGPTVAYGFLLFELWAAAGGAVLATVLGFPAAIALTKRRERLVADEVGLTPELTKRVRKLIGQKWKLRRALGRNPSDDEIYTWVHQQLRTVTTSTAL